MRFTPKGYEESTQDINEAWARSVSEQQLVDALKSAPFWQHVPEREQELRKAWRIMNGKPVEQEKPAVAEAQHDKKQSKGKGDGVA